MGAANPHNDSVIVQEMIDGAEHGLDVLNNLSGEFTSVYAKKKMGMRAGETDKARLVDNADLNSLGERLGKALKHVGNLDVDVFVTDDQRLVVLELNPRFGGGYPFSHELGARYPEALLAWAEKRTFDSTLQTKSFDKTVAKCDRLVFINSD